MKCQPISLFSKACCFSMIFIGGPTRSQAEFLACCAVARGTTIRRTCVLPIATGTIQRTRTTTTGFVVRRPFRKDSRLFELPELVCLRCRWVASSVHQLRVQGLIPVLISLRLAKDKTWGVVVSRLLPNAITRHLKPKDY